jgi:hypothetical protein
MGLMTAIIGIGVAATVAGTVMSASAAQQQAKAQKQSLAAQQRAEDTRQVQMNLDATRRQRQLFREQQRARAQGLAMTTAAGSSSGSIMAGMTGSIAGQTGVNVLGVEQNREFGNQIFSHNRDATRANIAAASAGGRMAMGQGISSLGGALISNAGQIGRIGSFFSGGRIAV